MVSAATAAIATLNVPTVRAVFRLPLVSAIALAATAIVYTVPLLVVLNGPVTRYVAVILAAFVVGVVERSVAVLLKPVPVTVTPVEPMLATATATLSVYVTWKT
jgi:hypothetical protein